MTFPRIHLNTMAMYQLQMQLAPITAIEDGPKGKGTLLSFYSSKDALRNDDHVARREKSWLILEFESNAHLIGWIELNLKLAQAIRRTLRD